MRVWESETEREWEKGGKIATYKQRACVRFGGGQAAYSLSASLSASFYALSASTILHVQTLSASLLE